MRRVGISALALVLGSAILAGIHLLSLPSDYEAAAGFVRQLYPVLLVVGIGLAVLAISGRTTLGDGTALTFGTPNVVARELVRPKVRPPLFVGWTFRRTVH